MCCCDSGTDGESDFNKRCSGHKSGAEAGIRTLQREGGPSSKPRPSTDEVFARITTQFWAEQKVTQSVTKDLIFKLLFLSYMSCVHTHTHIYKCTGVRKKRKLTEPSASQVARQSGWKRCHQFVPSHRGHAGDGEAMAAPCPHHG